MEEKPKRKQFRPVEIWFETRPLTIEEINFIQKGDREYVNIKDRTGVMFNCFEPIVYRRLTVGKRYRLTGQVNCTLGSKFLTVQAYEETTRENEGGDNED